MILEKVCCIGAGFVGGTFSSVAAHKCPEIEVHVIDQNEETIQQWNSDRIPIFEPGLQEMVKECRGRNLFFTADVSPLKGADIIFVCSDANARLLKSEEMSALENATRLILDTVDSSTIVVEKSVVAIQAAEAMRNILKAYEESYRSFVLIANPEFLTEGQAVSELLNPDRVLIGGDNTTRTAKAVEVLISLYERWVPRSKIITSDMWSTELLNLVRAAFLAQTITSMNSFAELCEITHANISKVAKAIAMDSRIGVPDLEKYVGFRGLNFLKSIQSIIYLCNSLRLPKIAAYWQKVLDESDCQKHRFAARITDEICDTLTGRNVAVLGFTLKKDTTCTHDSAAVYISKNLLKEGARLKICDSVASAEAILKDLADVLHGSPLAEKVSDLVEVFSDPYEAASGTMAIVLCTDWPQLVDLDFLKIFNDMNKPAYIFDGNNVLRHKELQEIGFQVQTVGNILASVTAPESIN